MITLGLNKYTLRTLVIIFSLFACFSLSAQTDYFRKYQALADSLEKEYSIPSCLILGVGFVESGGGTSKVAKNLNNHFGIVGKNPLNDSGKFKSRYKYYPSVTESFVGFCRLISSKKYYTELKGEQNIEKWATKIASNGYAKDAVHWTAHLLKVSKSQCQK